MINILSRIRDLSPFSIASDIREQEAKDKRIQRLEKVNGYTEERIARKRNYMRENMEGLEETVKNALAGFDKFTGKDDD